MKNHKKLQLIIASVIAFICETFVPVFTAPAYAAAPPQFTQAFLRLDRHAALAETGGTICATTNVTTTTVAYIEIVFPTQTGTDFVVDSTAAHWATDTTNLPTGATIWPGVGLAATSVTGHTVRFTSTDLTANTQYCFKFVSGTGASDRTLKNGSAGNSLTGTIHTLESDGTTIVHETNYATSVITDDQITVSAVVPPTFVFTLSGNTDGFGSNLDPSVVKSTSGRTISVTTNAKGGWVGWVKDSNQGLYSTTANYTIPTAGTVNGTPSSLAANSEGFVMDADLTTDAAGGCTVAIDAEYNGATGSPSVSGGTLSANFQPFVACTGAAPATSNGDVVTLIERASIAGGTPAGSDYTDVLTIVAAGNF